MVLRKRQRPWAGLALLTVGASRCEGFLPLQESRPERAFRLLAQHSALVETRNHKEKASTSSRSRNKRQRSGALSFPISFFNFGEQEVEIIPDRVDEVNDLPPWLSRYYYDQDGSDDDGKTARQRRQQEIRWLEYLLLRKGFSILDVREIVQALRSASNRNTALEAGLVDFCKTLLTLEDKEVMHQQAAQPQQTLFVSKKILLASIVHYCECIHLRARDVDILRVDDPTLRSLSLLDKWSLVDSTSSSSSALSATYVLDREVQAIVDGAARLKRAEMVAGSLLHSNLTPEQAGRLRNMYLSVVATEDWRGLVLRCTACLYRLDGILQVQDRQQFGSEYLLRTPETIRVAREALRVYATLAQRLGMHRLKQKLEDRAFRILYRRQYKAVSSLYQESGATLHTVSDYLLTKITNGLKGDDQLMEQLEDLQVYARVKEPYSFWKKLLRQRFKQLPSSEATAHKEEEGDEGYHDVLGREGRGRSRDSSQLSSELVATDIHDVVALRVILKARKYQEDESEEVTRAREKLLCYYVQHCIRALWPELSTTRVKDYIQSPKPNGYQSLHHTSSIAVADGIDFPFEVQVRSQEMHEAAEYGVASHWYYKLGSQNQHAPAIGPSRTGVLPSLPGSTTSLEGSFSLISKDADERSSPYLGSTGSYLGALMSAQREIVEQQVYVFLAHEESAPQTGRVVALPTSGRVEDVLSVAEISWDDEQPVIWRNGEKATLDDPLENGDVLLVAQ